MVLETSWLIIAFNWNCRVLNMDTNSTKMVTLNGSNYQVWKRKMEDILYVNDFLHLSIFFDEKPDDKTDKEWELYNRKVCGFMRLWIKDNFLNHICEETHA